MIIVKSFTFNPFRENTYVVYDSSGEALIVDPGCGEAEEEQELQEFIAAEKLQVKHIVSTHSHIDHVLGAAFVKEHYYATLMAHPNDEETRQAVAVYAPSYGFPHYREALVDRLVEDGDHITWGKSMLKVIWLPGHAPGHIGLFSPSQRLLLSGDVLFKDSIGRTDLPGGDTATLMHSIQHKLFALPDNVVVYPGHGSTTTLGREKVFNPFCGLTSQSS